MANSIKLFEDNAGNLLMVDGDIALTMTQMQFDSTFRADAEGWIDDVYAADDPGTPWRRQDGDTFATDHGATRDLSEMTHIATYEDGEVTRHAEGGLAANNYLSS